MQESRCSKAVTANATAPGGDPARGDLRLQVELALKLEDLPRLSATP
jgi:hypothetical protein